MNGLELSRAFFESHGKPMLEQDFPGLLPLLAVGLFGSGSECFGYDDDVSRDHDYEPGFCIFLPGEELISRRDEFLLERAYAKLPKSFMGIERQIVLPVGGSRHGVLRTEAFFLRTVGTPDGNLDLSQWLSLPEQALAEATNGEMFLDNYGEVTRIRSSLSYFPEDVRLKRLAGHLLLMAQSGQYNYRRCLNHGEPAAAQLAVTEYVRSCLSVVFLLNCQYQPYYKWVFRALRNLSILSDLAAPLEYLLTTENDTEHAREKETIIEDIAAGIVSALAEQSLTRTSGNDLERHAYSVNDRVKNNSLRTAHILTAV